MELRQSDILRTHQEKDIYLFTLKNDRGIEVAISNYGAIIQSFIVPDKSGKATDIVLGFDESDDYFSEEYLNTYLYFGAVVGRYANWIAQG